MRRRATLFWVALAATPCLAPGADAAQERGQEHDEHAAPASTEATTEKPEATSDKPASRGTNSGTTGADRGASQDGRSGTAGRPAVAPAPASAPLKRINTKPLSASANIALPQDI